MEQWLTIGLVVFIGLSQVARLAATVNLVRREETAQAAALRAKGWNTVGKAMYFWAMGVLFAPAGLMLAMDLLRLELSSLSTVVRVFGGLVVVLGAYFVLAGFSSLAVARRLIREANANPGV